MDFVKKEWQFRDIITEGELNRIEEGVEEGITKAEAAQQAADNAQTAADEANQKADQNTADLIAHLNDFAQVWEHRIVEMGTNINGTYVRLESGLQICFGRPIVFTGDGTTDVKSGTIVYPASFVEPPTLIGKSQGVSSSGDMNLLWELYVYEESISIARWVAMRRSSYWSEGFSYRANYLAIGRWK